MPRIMNRLGWSISGAVALGLLAALVGVIYAGPLDPPKPPAPTQQGWIYQPASTLSPAAQCALFPITISSPGSYKLAENIDMGPAAPCAKDGIKITATDVTLDLNGFRVSGLGASSGITTTCCIGNSIVIRNGSLFNWGVGIDMTSVHMSRVENVEVNSALVAGIKLGNDNSLSSCKVFSGGPGIVAGARDDISRCSATANNSFGGPAAGILLGDSSRLSDCIVSANIGIGIALSGSNAVVSDCTAASNTHEGIEATGKNDKIVRNHAADNSSVGIGLGSTCTDIWAGGPGTIVEDNTAEGTAPGHCPFGGDGAGSVVFGNTARNGVAGGDYDFGACAFCDVGTISTAAGATNPRGNVGD